MNTTQQDEKKQFVRFLSELIRNPDGFITSAGADHAVLGGVFIALYAISEMLFTLAMDFGYNRDVFSTAEIIADAVVSGLRYGAAFAVLIIAGHKLLGRPDQTYGDLIAKFGVIVIPSVLLNVAALPIAAIGINAYGFFTGLANYYLIAGIFYVGLILSPERLPRTPLVMLTLYFLTSWVFGSLTLY